MTRGKVDEMNDEGRMIVRCGWCGTEHFIEDDCPNCGW